MEVVEEAVEVVQAEVVVLGLVGAEPVEVEVEVVEVEVVEAEVVGLVESGQVAVEVVDGDEGDWAFDRHCCSMRFIWTIQRRCGCSHGGRSRRKAASATAS